MELPDLVAKLQAIAAEQPGPAHLRARRQGELPTAGSCEVMGTITQGGFTKVALLAEPPAGASRPPPAGAATSPAPAAPPSGAAPGRARSGCAGRFRQAGDGLSRRIRA